jgi:hypothetical protein
MAASDAMIVESRMTNMEAFVGSEKRAREIPTNGNPLAPRDFERKSARTKTRSGENRNVDEPARSAAKLLVHTNKSRDRNRL